MEVRVNVSEGVPLGFGLIQIAHVSWDSLITLSALLRTTAPPLTYACSPKDFTFVCPTEIIAFSDRAKEFAALNTQLLYLKAMRAVQGPASE
eukprot:1157957-Pelagomonas_calceolata.AAC.16